MRHPRTRRNLPDVFFSRSTDPRDPSPLVPQALALVGAGCVAATRGRAAPAHLGGIADDFAYLADVPGIPQLTESAGVGEKRLLPSHRLIQT